MFSAADDGDVQNRYQLRILNKTQDGKQYRVEVLGLDDMTVTGVAEPIPVQAAKMITASIRIQTIDSSASPIEYAGAFIGPT